MLIVFITYLDIFGIFKKTKKMNNNIYNYVLFHFTSFLQMTKKRNTSRVWNLLFKLNPIEREMDVKSIKKINGAVTTSKSIPSSTNVMLADCPSCC